MYKMKYKKRQLQPQQTGIFFAIFGGSGFYRRNVMRNWGKMW
jgi:hypothetical protein